MFSFQVTVNKQQPWRTKSSRGTHCFKQAWQTDAEKTLFWARLTMRIASISTRPWTLAHFAAGWKGKLWTKLFHMELPFPSVLPQHTEFQGRLINLPMGKVWAQLAEQCLPWPLPSALSPQGEQPRHRASSQPWATCRKGTQSPCGGRLPALLYLLHVPESSIWAGRCLSISFIKNQNLGQNAILSVGSIQLCSYH